MAALDNYNQSSEIIGNIPGDTTFENTNEALNDGKKELANPPYVFSNTEPRKKYDVRNLAFSPLLDYKGLENTNNGKVVKPYFEFSNENNIKAKANNVCNITHSSKYDIGYKKGYTASDNQQVAGFETPFCGLASAMRLLRGEYNNRSITEIDGGGNLNGGWQGHYVPSEHMTLSALRLIWITNNARNLNIQPNDKLNLNDPDSLKCVAASIAVRETSSEFTKEYIDKAYTLAFPEEQGSRGILYDYDGNVSYEGELVNGKENGKGKGYKDGNVYEGTRENGVFKEGLILDENGERKFAVENGETIPYDVFMEQKINVRLSILENKIKNTGEEEPLLRDSRGSIKFSWSTKTITSRGNSVKLENATEVDMKLKGLNLTLPWEQGARLANFKNRFKNKYKGKQVQFKKSYINRHLDWNKTFHVDDTMLLRRKDVEKYFSKCSDDAVMEKITEWLNK